MTDGSLRKLDLDAAIAEHMLVRLRNACVVALFALAVSGGIYLLEGEVAIVVATTFAWLTALGLHLAIRRRVLQARQAGMATFVLWAMLSLSSTLTWILHGPMAATWLVIIFLGYASIQLERGWFGAALVLGACAWLVGTYLDPHGQFRFHLISLAATTALGVLSHRAGRSFVLRVERLHAEEQRRAGELAAALADARHEIDEREHVESERERMREQFIAAQRMEAVGTLASGVAHDMNNVLAGIQGIAEAMNEDVSEDLQPDLATIVASCQRGAKLTRALLAFSRREKLRREPVSLSKVAEEVRTILERTAPKTVNLRLEVADHPQLEGDPTHVSQALLNVALNGIDAMHERGPLTISVRSTIIDDERAAELGLRAGNYGVIQVRDEGDGMDETTRRRVFEPFFTTKTAGKGTGLGLSMVYGTVKAHEGAVSVVSALGKGTTVSLYYPVAATALDVLEDRPSALPAAEVAHARLLVVDDEAVVRDATRRLLERAGHEVVLAENGAEALAIYARERDRIQLVLLDMAMPVMTGAECFRRLRELEPTVKVVVVTGYVDREQAASIKDLGPSAVLEKPVTAELLEETVRRVLRPSRHRSEGLVDRA